MGAGKPHSIREVISSEMWFTLNRFYLMVRDATAPRRAADDPHTFYTDIKTACALFIGESTSTMSHGEGWHFGRIGRFLERADKTSRILDVKYYILLPKVEHVGMPIDTLQWVALLKSASAFEMYRKVFNTITPKGVSAFLLLDHDFPRAVQHCLKGAEESLRAITGTAENTFSNPAEQRLGRSARSQLRQHRRGHQVRPARIRRPAADGHQPGGRCGLSHVL